MKVVHENVSAETVYFRRQRREMVEALRRRVDLLRGRDRLLMKMYLENCNTIGQLARLSGRNPSSVYRRIRRLTRLLVDGEYIRCLKSREKFSRLELEIAREHFLDGKNYKEIAERHGLTRYRVGKIVRSIRSRVK